MLTLNPIRTLTPESLTRALDAFRHGHLAAAARLWEAIEHRDDLLKTIVTKRKSDAARHGFEVTPHDDSPTAQRHAQAIRTFFQHATASHALDHHLTGRFPLLTRQMMDAIGKTYAVHEITWIPLPDAQLTAHFRFVPLWYFENTSGRLHLLPLNGKGKPTPLTDKRWMVTTGDGLMEASSLAYLYKHLPLRDWLLYCERHGLPGIKATTDAPPHSPAWEAARDAVEAFGSDFRALFSRGTDIHTIDLNTASTLPFPALVERMDRALLVLWRGSDLSTLSRAGGLGASLQHDEAAHLAHSLNLPLSQQQVRSQLNLLPPLNPQDTLNPLIPSSCPS